MSSIGYLYCRDCGEYMDEVEALRFTPEVHDELEGKPTEWIGERRCIYCGSDDLEEAAECQDVICREIDTTLGHVCFLNQRYREVVTYRQVLYTEVRTVLQITR